jgi:lysophospholipase L1-like esterase
MVWYEEDVRKLEKEISTLQYQPQLIFYGSSSIRLWESLYEDFKMYSPLNLGFGGSTLEACVYFFKRIMKSLSPNHLVIYAGDNDLGDGKTAVQVHGYFIELCKQIDERFGNLPTLYISIKPSLSRWQINEEIKYANRLIEKTIRDKPNLYFVDVYNKMIGKNGLPVKDLYDEDGLHLSKEGYKLWKHILLTDISSNVDRSLISVL